MKCKKLLIIPLFVSLFCGCELNIYRPGNDTIDTSTTQTNKEDINYVQEWDYNGNVEYGTSTTKLTPEEVYQKRISSTVYVITTTADQSYLGSGVFFSEDTNDDGYAYLFTNAHVVENAVDIEIVYSNYKRSEAILVGYHVLEDIAVLAVKKNNNYTIAPLKNSDELQPATEVLAIGTPISTDYSFSATNGIISKVNSPLTSTTDPNYNLLLIQIDATLNSGNSGGPLFDMYGNLIGLNTMKILYDESLNTVDDLNFSIPIDRAIFMANNFFNNKEYHRGLLGVTIVDIVDLSIDNREADQINLEHGLVVKEVSETGASFNLIYANDIITKINGIEFINKNQFQKELFKYAKNENVTLTVYRNNTYIDITITLK